MTGYIKLNMFSLFSDIYINNEIENIKVPVKTNLDNIEQVCKAYNIDKLVIDEAHWGYAEHVMKKYPNIKIEKAGK